VIFDAVDSGGTNFVDRGFAINALHYTAAGAHITDLSGGSQLQVTGNASVGAANASQRGSLLIRNGTTVAANAAAVNVGVQTAGTGDVSGELRIERTASLLALTAEFSIGRNAVDGDGDAAGSLTLASNSLLDVGTAASPATLNIGWNQASFFGDLSNVTGTFDALDPAATVNLRLSELNVGRGGGQGTATGTLRWNQSEVIDATDVFFGRGNSTGVLDVPSAGTVSFGSASDRLSTLRIAYQDSGGGIASANLNLSTANPIFQAFIASDLSIGRNAVDGDGDAAGSLTLASNSLLDVGTAASPATLKIGWNQASFFGDLSNVTGTFDALDPAATVNLRLSELNVGRGGGQGTAAGTFLVGNGVDLDATTVNIGVGAGATGTIRFVDNFTGSFDAGTVNLGRGTFDLGNNTLVVGPTANTISTDTVNLSGGTLSVGTFNVSTGTLGVQLRGNVAGTDYGQVSVEGAVNLNAGAALDVQLGFAPAAGSSFLILANDGTDAVAGQFAGLPQGTTFAETFGGQTFNFQITYAGGDGNDVALLLV
jgi:hypothetical protein